MCDFCEHGKMIKEEYMVADAKTIRLMRTPDLASGVAWIDGNKMFVDNSDAEYAALGFEIKYCPFCGSELRGDNNAAN